MTLPRGVLLVSGSAASATLRYRVRQPEEALRAAGVRTAAVHVSDRRAAALADAADVVVLYRCPGSAELVALVERLRRRPVPPLVTYDVDDLVFRVEHLAHLPFLGSLTAAQRSTFERDVRLRERLVPLADVVTGSTQEVLDELAKVSDAPGILLPNAVGRVQRRVSDAALGTRRAGDRFRVGYFSGSATHDEDWRVVEPVLVELLRSRPDIDLVLVGKVRPSAALDAVGGRVRRLPYVGWTELPDMLRAVDVTVAPLAPNPFTEAKSAIKWLEAALVGTPTVASPSGPFRAAVEDGRTGFLASTPDEWSSALLRLAGDPGLRGAVGSAARAAALGRYGPDAQAPRLLDVVSRRPEPDRWRPFPARHADPLPSLWRWAPTRLEAYPFEAGLATVQLHPAGRDRAAAAVTGAAGRAAAGWRRVARAVRARLSGRRRRSAGGTSP